MTSNFDFEFANKFRGSENDVLKRLTSYDGLLKQILLNVNDPSLLDIGSGRGEWLKKCFDLGFNCTGIDVNKNMTNFSKDQNINVIYNDALNTLKNFDDHTFDVVSSFHMIEHLDQEYLSRLYFNVNEF